MNDYLRLVLQERELLIAELAAPAELACESGLLWLSSSARHDDLVLAAGEQVRLGRGRLLLEGPAALCFRGAPLSIFPRTQSRPGN